MDLNTPAPMSPAESRANASPRDTMDDAVSTESANEFPSDFRFNMHGEIPAHTDDAISPLQFQCVPMPYFRPAPKRKNPDTEGEDSARNVRPKNYTSLDGWRGALERYRAGMVITTTSVKCVQMWNACIVSAYWILINYFDMLTD